MTVEQNESTTFLMTETSSEESNETTTAIEVTGIPTDEKVSNRTVDFTQIESTTIAMIINSTEDSNERINTGIDIKITDVMDSTWTFKTTHISTLITTTESTVERILIIITVLIVIILIICVIIGLILYRKSFKKKIIPLKTQTYTRDSEMTRISSGFQSLIKIFLIFNLLLFLIFSRNYRFKDS